MKYYRTPPLNLIQQYLNLTDKYEDLIIKKNYKPSKYFEVVMKVKPTDFSREYNLLVRYDNITPHVWALDIENDGKTDSVPHIYRANKEKKKIKLCLYYPKYREWTKQDYISEYLIPWAIKWFFYYELWLSTGKWLGGGIHE